MNFRKSVVTGLVVSPALVLPAISYATGGPDFSSLTSAVDLSTAVTAVLAIGAAIAVVSVAIKGTRAVLGMISR